MGMENTWFSIRIANVFMVSSHRNASVSRACQHQRMWLDHMFCASSGVEPIPESLFLLCFIRKSRKSSEFYAFHNHHIRNQCAVCRKVRFPQGFSRSAHLYNLAPHNGTIIIFHGKVSEKLLFPTISKVFRKSSEKSYRENSEKAVFP